jgi:hypothetical protein
LDLKGRKMDHGENCISDELHDLYSSPNIVRVIKSRRMKWAGHVAHMGEGRGEVFTRFWLGGPKAGDQWEDLGVGGRITLKWTLGRWESMGRTGFGWLRIRSSGRPFLSTVVNLRVP